MTEEENTNRLDKQLKQFLENEAQIDSSAWIAPEACIIGDVRIAASASVWPGCVLRGDINYIEIGEASNIQDGCVLHLADEYPVRIGNHTTVGHMAMIHACTIGNECLIGMHSTILDGAVIEDQCIIGAHTLVTQDMHVPAGSMVLGVPGKIVQTLDITTRNNLRKYAEKYVLLAKRYQLL